MNQKACEQGQATIWRLHVARSEVPEGARLLRSAAELMSPMLGNDLLEIAKELEELANIVERLRFRNE